MTIGASRGLRTDVSIPYGLTLLGPSGQVVAETTGENNAKIDSQRLRQGGTYTAVVWTEDDRSAFRFVLSARNVASDTDSDGLTDYRERTGVPLNPLTVGALLDLDTGLNNPTQLTTVGTGTERNALELDPDARDTDGDGLNDDEEVGEFVAAGSAANTVDGFLSDGIDVVDVGGLNGFYTLRSDPTDPNTDDVGFEDDVEVEQGSDPFEREQLLATFAVPTVAEGPNSDGQPELETSGNDYAILPETAWSPDNQRNIVDSGGDDSAPDWVTTAYDQTGRDADDIPDNTHVLISVPVYIDAGEAEQKDIPDRMEFDLPDSTGAEVIAHRKGDDEPYLLSTDVNSRVNRVALVIDTGEDLTDATSIIGGSSGLAGTGAELGRIRMSMDMRTDSIFIRPEGQRNSRRINVTTDRGYVIGETASQELGQIGDSALSAVETSAIQALSIQLEAGPGSAAKIGAKTGNEFVRIAYLGVAAENTIAGADGESLSISQLDSEADGGGSLDADGQVRPEDAVDAPQSVRVRGLVIDDVDEQSKTEIGNFEPGRVYVTPTGALVVRYV